MEMINKDFTVTEDDISSFHRKGFLLLKGFFTKEMINIYKGGRANKFLRLLINTKAGLTA